MVVAGSGGGLQRWPTGHSETLISRRMVTAGLAGSNPACDEPPTVNIQGVELMKPSAFRVLAAVAVAGALGGSLGGCASIMTGTTQRLAVNSTPSGANCQLTRDNKKIGSVVTPGQVEVSKSAYSILVDCNRSGVRGQAIVESSLQAATFGNALVGGAIGAGVDFYTGAAHAYPPTITVPMGGGGGGDGGVPGQIHPPAGPSGASEGEPVS